MSKSLALILILVSVVILGTLAYFVYQNQLLLNQLSKQPAGGSRSITLLPSTSPVLLPSPTPSVFLTPALTQDAIRVNINAKNYQGLVPYMTSPKVNLTIEASECCQPQTPAEAVSQMNYLTSGAPFDFNQNTDIVKNLKAKNSQLANYYIGISTARETMVAFLIDNDSRISKILMAVSYKLY